MAFRDLKQNRKKQLEKIAAEFSKHNSSEAANTDERFWYPDVDKAGNGKATIRFLPAPDGEDSPTVRIYTRSFQGPTGKWYINNCLTTIGQDDPVNDLNRKIVAGREWDSLPDKIKEVVRKQKRKTTYISNIYVVSDPAHPENEGKVFLYKYGPQIRDMINEKMNPTFDGEERLNPFDLWDGANFVIRITRKDKYRNYEKSSFDSGGPLFDNDGKMEEVWKQAYSLQAFIAPDQFKSREELDKQLARVLGEHNSHNKVHIDETIAEDEVEETSPKKAKESKPAWEDDDDDEINPNFFNDIPTDDEDEDVSVFDD